jgi:hypothetical protein
MRRISNRAARPDCSTPTMPPPAVSGRPTAAADPHRDHPTPTNTDDSSTGSRHSRRIRHRAAESDCSTPTVPPPGGIPAAPPLRHRSAPRSPTPINTGASSTNSVACPGFITALQNLTAQHRRCHRLGGIPAAPPLRHRSAPRSSTPANTDDSSTNSRPGAGSVTELQSLIAQHRRCHRPAVSRRPYRRCATGPHRDHPTPTNTDDSSTNSVACAGFITALQRV